MNQRDYCSIVVAILLLLGIAYLVSPVFLAGTPTPLFYVTNDDNITHNIHVKMSLDDNVVYNESVLVKPQDYFKKEKNFSNIVKTYMGATSLIEIKVDSNPPNIQTTNSSFGLHSTYVVNVKNSSSDIFVPLI